MKKILFAFIFFAFQAHLISQQNYLDTIWSGGILRTFKVYVPTIYDGLTARPLVFHFHGVGNTAAAFENYTKFKNVADSANFILVTPNGTIGTALPPNYGQAWNNFDTSSVDDVLFVSNLIDTLLNQYTIDTTRIYSVGFSNGGFMGYDLACRLGNRIAAIASVGGSIGTLRLPSCNPSRAVPIVEIHGTMDPVVPYNGGSFASISLSPVDSVINLWIGNNQCDVVPIVSELPNTNTSDGSTVIKYKYQNCADNTSVELFKIIGGGHTWPGNPGAFTNQDIIADQEIWLFFLKHSLPTTNSTSEQLNFGDFKIFPNPTSDYLLVHFPNNSTTIRKNITIFDPAGRACLKATLNSNENRINIGQLPSGMYFLELQVNEGRYWQKIIVQ